ncbi:MAG: TonB-dependent receptor [Candidatus Lambdaproteobacteria bacterium]|nr:TonB-dependent receptor [Candidatus Lambdaproteobacteria bacterium]
MIEGGEDVVRPEADAAPAAPLPSSGYQPGSRTVISRAQFADTQQTVADVLQEVPGVTVVRAGDALAPAKVSIRGSRPDQVLLIIDGVPVRQETGDAAQGRAQGRQGADLARLPLEQVESIEVLRGAASSLYGPGAAAGAVIVRTRRAARRQVELAATAGTSGYREWQGAWSEPLRDGVASLRLNHRRSDGEYLYFDPLLAQGTAASVGAAAQRCAPVVERVYRLRRCNARELSALALDWRRGADQRWSAELSAERRDGLGGVQDPRPFGREEQRRVALGFADVHPLDGEDRWGLTLNGAHREETRTENRTLPAAPLLHQRESQAFGDAWRELWLGRQQWRLGGSAQQQALVDDTFDAARSQGALYAQWRAHLPRGTLEAALRQDAFSDIAAQGTYRLAASHFVLGPVGGKVSQGTGYRPPTLNELFDPGSELGPSAANPALRPEASLSQEAGLFLDLEPTFYAEAQAFRQVLEEAIVLTARADNPNRFRFENVSRTRSEGLELSANLRAPGGWNLDGAWTRQTALIEANDRLDPRDNGKRVPGVPDEHWSATLAWRPAPGWSAWAGTRYQGRRFVDTANTRFLRAYQVTDLGATAPLGWGLELALDVRNATNETYAELENFPAPGRQLLLTLRWRLHAPGGDSGPAGPGNPGAPPGSGAGARPERPAGSTPSPLR